MNSIISLTVLPAQPSAETPRPAGSNEPVLDAVLDVAIRLLLGFCDMAPTDEPPLVAVRGLAVRLRFCLHHVPVQRQRVEAGGGGGPDREHAGTMPAGELRPVGEATAATATSNSGLE